METGFACANKYNDVYLGDCAEQRPWTNEKPLCNYRLHGGKRTRYSWNLSAFLGPGLLRYDEPRMPTSEISKSFHLCLSVGNQEIPMKSRRFLLYGTVTTRKGRTIVKGSLLK